MTRLTGTGGAMRERDKAITQRKKLGRARSVMEREAADRELAMIRGSQARLKAEAKARREARS